jgi:hypothetical protein
VIDTKDQELLATSLRTLVAAHAAGDASAALSDFGMADLLSDETAAAVPLVFGLQGEHVTSSCALDDLILGRLIPVLPELRSAERVLLASAGDADGSTGTLEDGLVRATGISSDGRAGSLVAPVLGPDGDIHLVVIDPSAPGVRSSRIDGIDPWLGLVRFDIETASWAVGSPGEVAAAWEDALTWGRIALAHELIGASRASLQLAIDHSLERRQFGRRIASFQAVKHRLADVIIAIESGQAAADAAVMRPSLLSGLVAKAAAGTAAQVAAKHCLQVLGGIGFAWDHPLHRFSKRTLVLERLLGSTTELPTLIGRHLRARGEVPRLVEL